MAEQDNRLRGKELKGGVWVDKKASQASNRIVDKSYAERMADEAKEASAKKKQKEMDEALLPSPQVKRALAAATGFAK